MTTEIDPGSFRDPGGRVFSHDGRILRAVLPLNAAAFEAAKAAGIYRKLTDSGHLLESTDVEADSVPTPPGALYVMEHPCIPFISYPYEWSFALHRAAAIHHLDLHLKALELDFTLSDASAYNVQFLGTRPRFIDHLSLKPYEEGEVWAGHRQFCSQFLNPLVFWSRLRTAPNAWFRGSLEGITAEELSPLLSIKDRLSWTVLTHVVAQAALQRRQIGRSAREVKPTRLSKNALLGMLTGLRSYISKLRGPGQRTVWADYAQNTSYNDAEAALKFALVEEMVGATKPNLLFDLGCNTGDYSDAAMKAGASYVVGFDYDHAALDRAFLRFGQSGQQFLPLWMDAANPSPAQGWAQNERKGFAERAKADALIALALVHHIAIGRNVPLADVVGWIVGLAPRGIIEFPPKADPMVQQLLRTRSDIFADYNEEVFLGSLVARSRIVKTERLSEGGRLLAWYDRT